MEEWDFSQIIKRSGLKKYKHRISILEILESGEQPITADQLFAELRLRKVPANLSTYTERWKRFVKRTWLPR
jgi:Fe2+ or Zn2+ uptake regulation protein